MVLNKSEILDGVKACVIREIPSLEGEVELRYLSQKEINEIEEIETKAMGTFKTNERANKTARKGSNSQLTSEGEINLHATTIASNKAKIKAVSLSLSINGGDEWTGKDVESLPSAVFGEIYEEVRKLNHMGEDVNLEKEVDNFPEN